MCDGAVTSVLADFHRFNLAKLQWADLVGYPQGTSPTARAGHGFASDGSALYVYGGCNSYGSHHFSIRTNLINHSVASQSKIQNYLHFC
jgi:hypothetical protein